MNGRLLAVLTTLISFQCSCAQLEFSKCYSVSKSGAFGTCGTVSYNFKFCARSQDEADNQADVIILANSNTAPKTEEDCKSRAISICGSQAKEGVTCADYCKFSPGNTVQCQNDGDCLAKRSTKTCCSFYTSIFTGLCAMSASDIQLRVTSLESNSTCLSKDCYSAASSTSSSSLWLTTVALLTSLALLRL
ncbi:hypothetical protein GUITHDRAFT_138022 [Guillardia theta CCMP2712]|uniref:Uncharacterized protein n=1 Tax=Guillardia theta (strain CCMP2712) TaxID=905079 RepID=L1JER7_GUITC|nr:hypothetical protein GUITHDRAFT_138022 [Guillardia theta CCMP2712]EKX46634.1 hypothetical protein GUITHDRAFT_138022 [Guillardia theta CCMP2712]|eukprot:XP_005833614.1 hypothetical protein GUITHDRAFT_138022 [Guillardia theta CCMP2712]